MVTTLLAATTECSPIVTPDKIWQPKANHEPFFIMHESFKKIEPNDDTSITTTQTESIEIQDTEHILPSSPDESETDQ